MQNYNAVANGNPEFVDNRAVRVPQQLNHNPAGNGNAEFVDIHAAQGPQHLSSQNAQAAIILLAEQAGFKNRTATLGVG
jgi:hypothetical protein